MNKKLAAATKKHIEAQKKALEAARSSMARDMAEAAERTRKIEAEMKARWAAEDAAKGQ
jgi:hypothetical protein